ncbi:MAG: hypothetical protein M3Y34_04900, partial [Actinomycetota bacterium]|nr:hypothetical protein [Actinomycetota bacterium]
MKRLGDRRESRGILARRGAAIDDEDVARDDGFDLLDVDPIASDKLNDASVTLELPPESKGCELRVRPQERDRGTGLARRDASVLRGYGKRADNREALADPDTGSEFHRGRELDVDRPGRKFTARIVSWFGRALLAALGAAVPIPGGR